MTASVAHLVDRFSLTADDVRLYGATNMNYVAKPLAYVLATPGAGG